MVAFSQLCQMIQVVDAKGEHGPLFRREHASTDNFKQCAH